MKINWSLLVILFAINIAGCKPSLSTPEAVPPPSATIAPKGSPTQLSPLGQNESSAESINTPDSTFMTQSPLNTNRFVRLAEQDLADRLQIDVSEINFLKIIEIDWQDITLGCSFAPGQTLTKGKLSGYRIWLETNSKDYVYHVGLDGKIFLCPD